LQKQCVTNFNHIIGTLYNDNHVNIGWHSDKIKDIKEASWIPIVSFGATRTLSIGDSAGNALWEIQMEAGDLFLLGWDTNQRYKHAILPTEERCGARISLVFREIITVLTQEELEKKVKRVK